MPIAGVGTAGVCGVCAVGEADVAELGLEAVEGGTLVVLIDGGERGGELDAVRLLDRMITLSTY
jgi:hypothetical protein